MKHLITTKCACIVLATMFLLTPQSLAEKVTPPTAKAQLEALEKKFFQHTYSKDNFEHRLTRIEKFTFGETNKGTNEGRIARITEVIAKDRDFDPTKNAKPKTNTIAKTEAPKEAVTGSYPHILFLEDELLGKEYKGEAITTRLARLENHTFGKVSHSDDLSSRTDALERYAVTQLHMRPFIREKVNRHRTTRKVAHIPLRLDSFDPSELEAAKSTPPPPHSRLLSRIAWCEKHTFGRTYPHLHLLQRLHQLNSNLFPKAHTKDIQLMDKVDDMVRKVVLLQHPPKTAYRNS